jgi:hypothetical protein
MYIPVRLLILFLLYLVWQARQPRPTLTEYRVEQEARRQQRAFNRALRRERRAQARLLLQTQNRRKLAIIRAHSWHTAIVLTLIGIAGVLIWSVPPRVNPKAEPAWQAWPIGLIAWILIVFLWRFEALAKKPNGQTDQTAVQEKRVREDINTDEITNRRLSVWKPLWSIVFVVIPTATLLEHTLLAQGFMGGAKGHFPSLLATAKPRFDVCKFGRSTQVTL